MGESRVPFRTRPEFSEAQRLLRMNVPRHEVARRVGVSARQLSRVLPGPKAGQYVQSLTPERRVLLDSMVADGVSKNEICRSGFSWRTIQRHYPGYRGMSCQDGGALGRALRDQRVGLR